MGNPFRDKFLKAGLVNKKQVNKVKRDNHVKRKENKDNTASGASTKVQEQQDAQAQQIRELNLKRKQAKRQREQKAQVKQLIEQNRMEQDVRGEAYHFVQQNKIMRIFVAEEMIEQLSCGKLAIVRLGAGYEVVPAKVARQIAERRKEAIVAFHKKQS